MAQVWEMNDMLDLYEHMQGQAREEENGDGD